MSCFGAKIGDVVIGNQMANDIYFITRKGWIGIVTYINDFDNTFKAKSINTWESFDDLDFKCFDFVMSLTAPNIAKKLGFDEEENYDYNQFNDSI